MEHKKFYTEISLYNLFMYICQRWRSIIVCMIAGAVIAGGFSLYMSLLKEKPVLAIEEKRMEELAQIASQAERYASYIEKQQEYNEKSPFQKLDAFNLKRKRIVFYVPQSDNFFETDRSIATIVTAYSALIWDNALCEELRAIFGMDESDPMFYEDIVSCAIDYENGVVTYTIDGNDEKTVDRIAVALEKAVAGLNHQLSIDGLEHTIVKIGEQTNIINDPGVLKKQQDNINRVSQFDKDLKELEKAVKKDELNYYNSLRGIEKKEAEKASPRFDIKSVVLGLVAGLVVAAFLIAVKGNFQDTMKSRNDMGDFGIDLLGSFDEDTKFYKKRRTRLDRKIRNVRNKAKKRPSYEDTMDIIATKIELAADVKSRKSVCLAIGSAVESGLQFVDDIKERLKGKTDIVAVRDILGKSSDLREMVESDCVVFVEQVDKSKNENILARRRMCDKYGVDILGAIVLE
ncbi:MAG: hypothetical protein ACOX75_00040 [Lachnospiraceae bacterium]|jgi:capsular polysaccharide biosynthesis protein